MEQTHLMGACWVLSASLGEVGVQWGWGLEEGAMTARKQYPTGLSRDTEGQRQKEHLACFVRRKGMGEASCERCVHAESLQSCPTLCDPMDCSPPGSSVHGDSPGKNTGGGCDALLQGIFPTQGSNPHLFMFPALAGGFFTNSCHLGSPLEEVTSKLRPQVNRKGREFPREKEHVQGLGVRQHVRDWLCLGQKTGGQGWDREVQRGG